LKPGQHRIEATGVDGAGGSHVWMLKDIPFEGGGTVNWTIPMATPPER